VDFFGASLPAESVETVFFFASTVAFFFGVVLVFGTAGASVLASGLLMSGLLTSGVLVISGSAAAAVRVLLPDGGVTVFCAALAAPGKLGKLGKLGNSGKGTPGNSLALVGAL
jgi:hypothetical protein